MAMEPPAEFGPEDFRGKGMWEQRAPEAVAKLIPIAPLIPAVKSPAKWLPCALATIIRFFAFHV